jgi:hypothetical protein
MFNWMSDLVNRVKIEIAFRRKLRQAKQTDDPYIYK